jgi:hypothetical protein
MAESKPTKDSWQTYLWLGLSALGIALFLFQALSMAVVWLIGLVGEQSELTQTIPISQLVWSSILSGVLLMPVFVLSLKQLRGKGTPAWLRIGRPTIRKGMLWAILLWPVIVALGWFVAGRPNLAEFFLGPINILVAGVPVLWIFIAASWRLQGGSEIRQWRIFGFSLTLMPTIVILLELVAILVLVGFGGLFLVYRVSVDPILERELTFLIEQFSASGQDIDGMLALLEPYLFQPTILFLAVAVIGGVMPIIEEIVKPIALFPLAGKKISAQEGYVGGLLCGAGFALTENILYFTIATTAEDWLYMALGRAGTGVLHMLASGLVGWGLVKTWRNGKWLQQALLSMGAFFLHGLWNAMALFVGVGPGFFLESEPDFLQNMLFNIPILVLLILSMVGMFLINRYFRKEKGLKAESLAEQLQEEIDAVVS